MPPSALSPRFPAMNRNPIPPGDAVRKKRPGEEHGCDAEEDRRQRKPKATESRKLHVILQDMSPPRRSRPAWPATLSQEAARGAKLCNWAVSEVLSLTNVSGYALP